MLQGRMLGMAVCALAISLTVGAAQAREVKRCGITIGAGKTGTLVRDVECGYRCSTDRTVRCVFEREDYRCPVDPTQSCVPETITLERNATLDLNGFDLTAAYGQDTIICAAGSRSKCTLRGPGNFFAWKGRAITPNGREIVLQDVLIDRDYDGFSGARSIRASSVVLRNCSSDMGADGAVRATNVYLGGGCGLIAGGDMFLRDVTIVDGVWAKGTVRGVGVRSTDSSFGSVAGKDVFLSDSELGRVEAGRQLVLRDSTVERITTGDEPALIRSSCDHSTRADGTGTWGVCSLD
ncbi:hypothetical protein K2Z84_04210 [Candidatus Binatia bacterium]|nr:hypothetical protein [Candidatus Binatia bacterium]